MSGHVASVRMYVTIFSALMVLTIVTVVVAGFEFGWLNTPIALAVAITKATLVMLFFMHVKYSSRLVQVTAVASFLFLLILVTLTMSDYLTRDILAVGR